MIEWSGHEIRYQRGMRIEWSRRRIREAGGSCGVDTGSERQED